MKIKKNRAGLYLFLGVVLGVPLLLAAIVLAPTPDWKNKPVKNQGNQSQVNTNTGAF